MKVKFDKYTYYQDDDDVRVYDASKDLNLAKKYEYSPDHFNELLRNRQYDDAIAYASQYVPNNPKDRRDFETQLNVIKNQGRKITALYSRLDKDRDLPLVEFYDNVFVDGGIDHLSENNYVNGFIDLKRRLGSRIEEPFGNGIFGLSKEKAEIGQEATKVSITFMPKTQTLFGIDWLARDNNEYNIDKFYEASGLTENILKINGVTLDTKDGKTTLTFRKDNPLANTILYNTPWSTSLGKAGFMPQVVGLDDKNNIVEDIGPHSLGEFQNYIDTAKEAKDNALKVNNLVEKDYSGFQAGFVNDALEELRAYAEENPDAMTDSEFAREWKRLGGDDILTAVKTFGGKQEMYSNLFPVADGDRTMVKMEGQQRTDVINAISQAKKTNLRFTYGCVNGIVGTLITIDGQAKTKTNDESPRVQVFLPGFLSDKAQEAIQRNSLTRAAKELNDMQDWGHSYDCEDGTELMYVGTDSNGKGRFMDANTKKEYSKDEAAKILNKDMSIRDAKRQLKYNYMNVNGQLIDREGYDAAAQYWALQLADELDPGIPIYDFAGKTYDFTNPKDVEAIFNKEIDEENVQFDVYYKLQNIYDIYDKIMQAISRY